MKIGIVPSKKLAQQDFRASTYVAPFLLVDNAITRAEKKLKQTKTRLKHLKEERKKIEDRTGDIKFIVP